VSSPAYGGVLGVHEPDALMFRHRGFDIPVDLARMTGGGPKTWEVIARGHMEQYEHYAPISPDHTVFELGCGIGRDAIELTQALSPAGRYIGVDIIQPSIEWARSNVTPRFRQFEFHHFESTARSTTTWERTSHRISASRREVEASTESLRSRSSRTSSATMSRTT
jgi:hypothetical protein